jgi:3'-phosphoadenosine 5'-phosphosulfate sulfotransferase (PAPS reductase)/FAD synthetase
MYESSRAAQELLRDPQARAAVAHAERAQRVGHRPAREQSAQRSDVPFDELDDAGRTKFNPLADWSQADVWHYIRTFEVPYNALHDRFFPSIGCEPCTAAIALGEDVRAGRWWWESEGAKECGLHVHPAAETASSSSSQSRFTPEVPA